MTDTVRHGDVKRRLGALYDELFAHDGYAELRVEIRILKRGQKEVILHCGKQYRYVVDYRPAAPAQAASPTDSHAEKAQPGGIHE
ncbi:hypothetical protein [Methyloterricola oryzae]|uniref:hypothetical protein n=1 Tax=Methyloterricola oryzae TaxID=1495050 RepID=UPI0005EBE281|nr:hypothetical protein [Methyloterricola oryzae]